MKDKKQALSPVKKSLIFIKQHKVLAVIGVVVIFAAWLLFVPHGAGQNSLSDKPDFPKVDVAGLTVQEACKKIKATGWKSVKVEGGYGDWTVRNSDCKDKHIAEYANYTNKDEKWGIDSSATVVYDISDYNELTDSEKAKYKSLEKNQSSTDNKSDKTTSDGNSSENWRKALKDYEAYVDEYITFMKEYNANPNDQTLITQYGEMLDKLNDYSDSLKKVEGDLSGSDLKEYNKTMTRIVKKLSEIQ